MSVKNYDEGTSGLTSAHSSALCAFLMTVNLTIYRHAYRRLIIAQMRLISAGFLMKGSEAVVFI